MKKCTIHIRQEINRVYYSAKIREWTQSELGENLSKIWERLPKYLNTGYNRAYVYGYTDHATSQYITENVCQRYLYNGQWYALNHGQADIMGFPYCDTLPMEVWQDFTQSAILYMVYKKTNKIYFE